MQSRRTWWDTLRQRKIRWIPTLLAAVFTALPFAVDVLWKHNTTYAHDLVWIALLVPAAVLAYYYGLVGSICFGITAGSAVLLFEMYEGETRLPVVVTHDTLTYATVGYTLGISLVVGILVDRLHRQHARILDLSNHLREQARHDPLTGLANRTVFNGALEQAIAEAELTGGNAGLIILDLDHFKTCNDRLGHQAGDEVLKQVAEVLAHSVRADDLACRYGGDEFAIVLRRADAETCRAVAERASENVQSIGSAAARTLGGLSVSAGVAVYPVDGRTPPALIRQADVAMYKEKRLRRVAGRVAGRVAKRHRA